MSKPPLENKTQKEKEKKAAKVKLTSPRRKARRKRKVKKLGSPEQSFLSVRNYYCQTQFNRAIGSSLQIPSAAPVNLKGAYR